MLTPKQEKFAQGIIEGMSQADAYRSAYSCARMSDKTIWENASRLMADTKVKARVQELRDRIATDSIMSAQERLEWLSRLIENEDEYTSDKLKAIDLMNKMTGEYVQKIEADVATDIRINVELTDE
jgi:phage terminase small subunit